MIIREKVIINNKEFVYTYSDLGYEIERDSVVYSEAYDPIEYSDRTYVEVISENEQEISSEEFYSMIEEVL